MVYPSGRARATAAAPSEEPPPPMFSITTVPTRGFILSANGRPTKSNAPPGGNGTTSRMGLALVELLKIGALERILDYVKQEGIVEDFDALVVADACGALPLSLVTPE